MGKVTGFKEFDRKDESYKPVEDRLKHYNCLLYTSDAADD